MHHQLPGTELDALQAFQLKDSLITTPLLKGIDTKTWNQIIKIFGVNKPVYNWANNGNPKDGNKEKVRFEIVSKRLWTLMH